MPYTLAYLESPVPSIPTAPGEAARPEDCREYFGTEDAALRRAASLLPAPEWLDLRLYGPDGARLAGQAELERKLAARGRTLPTPAS